MNNQWVNKHELKKLIGLSPSTIKQIRLQENSPLIAGAHYVKLNARCLRYNAALMEDWLVNRHNPDAHNRAIELYLSSLPSNQPKRRGRKAK